MTKTALPAEYVNQLRILIAEQARLAREQTVVELQITVQVQRAALELGMSVDDVDRSIVQNEPGGIYFIPKEKIETITAPVDANKAGVQEQ